jgi:CheY-like chemotaxis protein
MGDSVQTQVDLEDFWTVFLVEDDLDDQRLAMRILNQSPHIGRVICISDSARLFDRLAKHQYLSEHHSRQKVLILLDLHMPGINGFNLLEQLRSSPYTCNFPIIMLTGDKTPKHIYESYVRAANAFLHKPLTRRNLADIHAVLEHGNGWRSGEKQDFAAA